MREVRGHGIGRGHTAQRHHVLVGPRVAHHADALDRKEHDECLPDLVIEPGRTNLLDHDGIGLAQRVETSASHLTEDSDAEAGTRERVSVQHVRRQAEFGTHRPDLVLEKLAKRLHQLEAHVVGQPSDIVMGLDRDRLALHRDALDHIGIQRPLYQKIDIPDLARLLFEDSNKEVTDDLAFLFGVCDAHQGVEKTLRGIHADELDTERVPEQPLDLGPLVLPHHAVIDEDAGQLVANRAMHEIGGDG